MSKSESLLRLTIPAVLALAGAALTGTAQAAEMGKEQCAGIAKAGMNDCATKTNACHGHVTVDSSPDAWIYVPTGTCERIVGAHLVVVEVPTAKPEK